jgi:transcriptional regulator with XRE-family HTH domain
MAIKPQPLSDQLRQLIADCGITRYRISKDTGVDQAVLEKFVNGKRGMSLQTLDILGEYLGLEIRQR